MKKEEKQKTTSFQTIYDSFLNLITDDMYVEFDWEKEEIYADVRNIFMAALSRFEFPRFKPYDHVSDEGGNEYFNTKLTLEEVNILAYLMMVEWVNRYLASVDVIRQSYGSRDFEFTSQANHLDKLIKLKNNLRSETTKLQRLYTRRKLNSSGMYVPNYEGFGGKDNAN